MTESIEHGFKPVAVAAGFQPDDHFAGELSIKLSYLVRGLMRELKLVNFAIRGITPHDELLPGVKIYSTICCHGDSSLVLKLAAILRLAARWSHLLHHIRWWTGRN